MNWEFNIHCPNPLCGKLVAGMNPRYGRSFPDFKPNGWVNVEFACTSCHAYGEVKMYRPNYVEV